MAQFIQHPATSVKLPFAAWRAASLVLLLAVLTTAVVLIASNANSSSSTAQPATKSAIPTTGGRTVPVHALRLHGLRHAP
jgi:hypothetical protein